MSKLFPTLLSFAFLLVLTSACNRDATEGGDSSGTFLAPAAAPLKSTARSAAEEGQLKDAPMKEETDVLPGEDEPGAQVMTAEELAAARTAGPGRTSSQPQARPANGQANTPAQPKTMAAPGTGSKPVIDYDRPLMTIRKMGCYGECRQFALTLTSDRRLVLDAGKNMKQQGKYTRALNAREYNDLLVAMQAANTEGLAPLYPNNIKQIPADAQATVLEYPDRDGNERKVEVYYDAPEKLDAMITSFDAWVDKDGWIKTME